MKVLVSENGNYYYRKATAEEIERFEKLQAQPVPEPEIDRLTALELAVAELGAVMMGGMTAKLYADLIQRGLWTIEQVPVLWRAEVEKLMEETL